MKSTQSGAVKGDDDMDPRPTIYTLHTRVSALEERMERFDFDQRQIKAELQSNTRLTEDIHGNTEGLVDFMKATKVALQRAARVGKWLTATCGGGAALVTFAKVLGWW